MTTKNAMERYADILDLPRPQSAHPRMALGNRANQFVPMDALRGFSVAVLTKQREKQLTTRITFSEDALEQLDWQLHRIQLGDTVTVTYFLQERAIGDLEIGTYVMETSSVEEVDLENHALILSDAYVPLSDLYIIESKIFDQAYEDNAYDGWE